MVHWPLMAQRGGDWDWQPAQAPPRFAINGQCSSVPITVLLSTGPLLSGSRPRPLLINGQCSSVLLSTGPLLCGFNVSLKG